MREWNGNKKSVRVMNGDAHNPDRAEADYYTTDPAAVEEFLNAYLCKDITGKRSVTVWEPACGNGNISKVLEKHFTNVYSSDLYDRGYGEPGRDFLKTALPGGTQLIITNPPYSLSDEFILHALDILPSNGAYIALLNINYLAGKKRWQTIYSKSYLKSVYVYTHRINRYKNNEQTGHSSPVNYAWFVFSKQYTGFNQSPQIHWI